MLTELTQCCSCGLVIYWEWFNTCSILFFSVSIAIWIFLQHVFSTFALWVSIYFSFILLHFPPPLQCLPKIMPPLCTCHLTCMEMGNTCLHQDFVVEAFLILRGEPGQPNGRSDSVTSPQKTRFGVAEEQSHGCSTSAALGVHCLGIHTSLTASKQSNSQLRGGSYLVKKQMQQGDRAWICFVRYVVRNNNC